MHRNFYESSKNKCFYNERVTNQFEFSNKIKHIVIWVEKFGCFEGKQ